MVHCFLMGDMNKYLLFALGHWKQAEYILPKFSLVNKYLLQFSQE